MKDLIELALGYAGEKHSGQHRKNTKLPYILHPMEAAVIAASLTDDEEVIAAAMLHDTIEDGGASAKEIRTIFGDRVAALVASETEDKRRGIDPGITWKKRKEESLEELRSAADPGVKVLWLSDKLSNMRSFRRQFDAEGSDMWKRYNQSDPAMQEWYYREIAKSLTGFESSYAFREYVSIIDYLFGRSE